MPRKIEPKRSVIERNSFSFRWSPSRTDWSAFTIVTDEQIRMKVFRAVSQMFSVSPGAGQVGLANRKTMYAPIKPVKNITSEHRKTHIPILSWGIPVADGGSRAWSCAVACSVMGASRFRQDVLPDPDRDQDGPEDEGGRHDDAEALPL